MKKLPLLEYLNNLPVDREGLEDESQLNSPASAIQKEA